MATSTRIWTLTGPSERARELLRTLSADGFAVQTEDSDDPVPEEVVIKAVRPDGGADTDPSATADRLGYAVEESDEDTAIAVQRDVVLAGSDERLVTAWISSTETDEEAIERLARFFDIPAGSLVLRKPLDLGGPGVETEDDADSAE